jgi:hypothetical protein
LAPRLTEAPDAGDEEITKPFGISELNTSVIVPTSKGDLLTASANDTPARLAVGANDLVLSADSTQPTGLKYTGSWTSWTPSGRTGLTVGNGSETAKYTQIGKIVYFLYDFVLGSTSAIGASFVQVALPKSNTNDVWFGNANYLDAGVANYVGNIQITGGFFILKYTDTASNITSTSPFTWGTGDSLRVTGFYEVA